MMENLNDANVCSGLFTWLKSGWLQSGWLKSGLLKSEWLQSGLVKSGWLKSRWLKSRWILATLSAWSLTTGMASANLVIQINQGVDHPFTVNIAPFAQEPHTNPVPGGLSGVIANDLSMTGQFVVDRRTQPGQSDDYAVVGKVQTLGSGQYEVQYMLTSTVSQQRLLGERFSGISQAQLRGLAHHISDQIYQYLTGFSGDFSTHLAYVAVDHPTSRDALYQLIVSDADGSNPQVLLKQVGIPIASPAWSPDGKKIAYVSYLNNRMVVYIINVYTGVRTLVADYPGMNSAPSFSPNGRQLALALSMGSSAQTNIYLLNLANHQLQRLTHLGTNTSPRFSPNGKNLIFTSDRTGNPQVYQMNLASEDIDKVTSQGYKNFAGGYTPDGKSIIVMTQATPSSPIRIAKVNLNSGAMTVLTKGQLDKSPSISPNGQMVLYANEDGARGILAETSIEGNVLVKLPESNGTVQSPAWSPS